MQKVLDVRELATSFEELTGINEQDEREVLFEQLREVADTLASKAEALSALPKGIKRSMGLKPAAEYEEKVRTISATLKSIAEKLYTARDVLDSSSCADENGETRPVSEEEKAELVKRFGEEFTEVSSLLQRTIAVAEVFYSKESEKAFSERIRREKSLLK